MIRDKFFKNITTTIDNHTRFDSSDFKIEPIKDSKNTFITLVIKYNIEPKYKIIFKIPSSTTTDKDSYGSYYAFSGQVSPGPLAYEESFSFKGEDGVYEKITTWLNCIWEELSSNPIVKQVENQQKQIDDIFEKFENIKDEFFSDEEAKDLRRRLDELEENLKSQISKTNEDKKSLEREVQKLHTDIDTLKQTIQSFKKKSWLKSFTTKVFKWTKDSDNRKMLKDGYSVIREFLPEEIKNTLPVA
jgi:polyhydroxyalkanoate synthesis regulator phasin